MPRHRTGKDADQGFTIFSIHEALQITAIVIAALLAWASIMTAAISGIGFLITSSELALWVCGRAAAASALTGIGTIALTWAHRFARVPAPFTPKH